MSQSDTTAPDPEHERPNPYGPYGGEAPEGTDGPAPVDGPAAAIPGVLILDTSWSMEAELATMTAALNKLIVDLCAHPTVAAQAHIAIVTFADTAATALPFCRIAEESSQVPTLQARGNGTNFVAALDHAYDVLDQGITALADAEGRRVVMRPTLYFVSDGKPNVPRGNPDAWRDSLRRLEQPRWRPNRFAFGFSQAREDTIRAIADEGLAYFAADGQTELGALDKVLQVMLQSMIRLSQGAGQTQQASPAPPAPPGFMKMDAVAGGAA